MGKLSNEEARKRVAARVEAAQEVLAVELASLVSGEDWRRYLGFQAKLHAYSANNAMLIAAQHARAYAEGCVSAPEPSWVAGFNTWKALGRMVEKGQRGYAVLAPIHGLRRSAADAEGNTRPLQHDDAPAIGEVEHRTLVLRGFKVEYVFDASQTHGRELPVPPRPRLLEGRAPPGLSDAVKRLIAQRGFRVETVPDAAHLAGANGQTRWDDRTVAVRSDMDDAAVVKTLIHEAAHVLLHEGPAGRYLPRPLKEVEAESVAFVVASVHGLATDDYSFPYVASWAGEQAARAVSETQARVANAAKAIIAVSPAEHGLGGRIPDLDAAITHRNNRSPSLSVEGGTAGLGGEVRPCAASVARTGPEVA
jgi:hypothetical protein